MDASFMQDEDIADLTAALSLISRLRGEKDEFRSQAERIREENLVLQEANSSLRLDIADSREQVEQVQFKHSTMVAEWEAEIAAHSGELEAVKDQVMTPDEVEVLRVQLLQEVEEPHRKRVDELEFEASKFRDMYNALHREHALLREEHEHQLKHGDAFERELEGLRKAEVAELKSRIEVLSLQANNPASAAEIRRLKRDRTELDLRSMSLGSELDEVTARAKQEQLENEQAMRLSNRTAAELRTSVKALTGEADSLRLQVARMQEEINAGQRANESARSDLHAAEKANIELRGDREDEAHQLRTQIRELETKCVKVKAEWDRDHQALSESVATGRNQAEVLERALESASSGLAEKERESSAKIHQAREVEWAKFRDLEREKMEIEGRLRETERQHNSAAQQDLDKQRQSQAELHKTQGELAEAKFTASTLQDEVGEMKGVLSEQKAQLDRLRHVESDLEKAGAKRETTEKTLVELQVAHADVRSKLAIKGNEFEQVQEEMEQQRRALKAEADDLRRSLATTMERADTKERSMTEDATQLYDKLQAVCTAASAQKARLKTERRELRVLVASLEDKLAVTTDAKQQADKANQQFNRELRTLQRKVEMFGGSIHTNGQASVLDLGIPPPPNSAAATMSAEAEAAAAAEVAG